MEAQYYYVYHPKAWKTHSISEVKNLETFLFNQQEGAFSELCDPFWNIFTLSCNLGSRFAAGSRSSTLLKKGSSGLLGSPWSESTRRRLNVAPTACYRPYSSKAARMTFCQMWHLHPPEICKLPQTLPRQVLSFPQPHGRPQSTQHERPLSAYKYSALWATSFQTLRSERRRYIQLQTYALGLQSGYWRRPGPSCLQCGSKRPTLEEVPQRHRDIDRPWLFPDSPFTADDSLSPSAPSLGILGCFVQEIQGHSKVTRRPKCQRYMRY